MPTPRSPEAVLIFLFEKARYLGLKPRQRVAYLRDLAALMAEMESAPVSLRGRVTPDAVATAMAWLREELPRLVG